MNFRQNITLDVAGELGGDVGAAELLKGWDASASVSTGYIPAGSLNVRIDFYRHVDLAGHGRVEMCLLPRNGQDGKETWSWWVETQTGWPRGIRREGDASSLPEATAAVDAAVAEIQALAPA
ncbi:hypothetical protein [Microvirga yunnanensis]|uniref:hypothetical protein n=1 Tax=Microvirga yunnanensis TaxID=2953740 RepID=UPI0021C87592|nr:hypothetical protein [Microvirga sp. HBU67655]